MKKRLLSLLLAGALTVTTLAGCGSGSGAASETAGNKEATSTEQGTGEKTKISLWTVFTGSDGDILKDIIKDYNATNKDNIEVDIDIMDNSTLQSKLPTAISTGTGPSFVLMGIEFMNQYVKNDSLEDISDFWDKTGIKQDNFYKNVLDKSYVDGKLYGTPMQYNLQYLYYNKDLFKKAGLDPNTPPATFEELEQDAEKLTDAKAGQYGLALPIDYGCYVQYLWGNGGDVADTAKGTNLLNSEANIKTLEWLQNMKKKGVSPDGLKAADADKMFQSGQVAMLTTGPWNINALNELGVNYGITAIPKGSEGAYAAEGGCSYMIPKGVDEKTKEADYKFMAYWLSDEVLKTWSTKNGFPVWSYSLLEDEDIKGNEILSDVSNASSIGRDWHLGYAGGSQIDNDVMQPMMEKILSGADVKDTVKTYSSELDNVLSANSGK